ncbi:ATP-binding protein [uncultured Methanobrevibacter sp.]|uniref:ATP-binding protein n=1 Tax=uncultured Methanobrevibacter sp. TaxID=253161 RepID=UPI0026091D97|nr:ATP-binding protein [uncultured Methanobrevibacter sp.]
MVNRQLYMDKVLQFMDKDIIKIITGIRRCGKSYLLKLIINELIKKGVNRNNILLMDFELPEYNNIKYREDLDEIVLNFINTRNDKVYLLFDEVQNVENWEISINSYYKLPNTDIYVTGSNSKLLSKDLTTFLTGRYISIELYPFSFSEFCKYKEELNEKCIFKNELNSPLENLFDEYLNYGGFPLAIMAKDYKTIVLNDLFSSIVLNDVVKRYEIRNVGLFFRITKYLMENVGNLISVNSIYNYLKHEDLKLTKNTVYNYLSYLEDAYFLLNATKEDLFGKKEIVGSEKYYLVDQGFYKANLEEKQQNKCRILENIIYLELLRKGYKVTTGKIKNYEVDFICKKDGEKVYIQVSYLLSDEKTIEREFHPLLEIKDNYPKYVISMDKMNMSRDGIKHLNVINFLKDSPQL